jgi:S-adenosylmethionine/arginine decarboxylase-like enzyme
MQRYELRFNAKGHVDALNDELIILKLLHGVAKVADMRVLAATVVQVGEAGHGHAETNEYGWTGCAIISTSHITIHTWPEIGKYMFDLVSCKDFDQTAVKKYIEDNLGEATELV